MDIYLQCLGTTIVRRFYEAVAEAREHRKQHIEFSQTFSAETISKWSDMVDAWNKDPSSSPDPYEEPALGIACFFISFFSVS